MWEVWKGQIDSSSPCDENHFESWIGSQPRWKSAWFKGQWTMTNSIDFNVEKWLNFYDIMALKPSFSYSNSSKNTTVKKLCKSKNSSNHRLVMLKNPLQITCDLQRVFQHDQSVIWRVFWFAKFFYRGVLTTIAIRERRFQGHNIIKIQSFFHVKINGICHSSLTFKSCRFSAWLRSDSTFKMILITWGAGVNLSFPHFSHCQLKQMERK